MVLVPVGQRLQLGQVLLVAAARLRLREAQLLQVCLQRGQSVAVQLRLLHLCFQLPTLQRRMYKT